MGGGKSLAFEKAVEKLKGVHFSKPFLHGKVEYYRSRPAQGNRVGEISAAPSQTGLLGGGVCARC